MKINKIVISLFFALFAQLAFSDPGLNDLLIEKDPVRLEALIHQVIASGLTLADMTTAHLSTLDKKEEKKFTNKFRQKLKELRNLEREIRAKADAGAIRTPWFWGNPSQAFDADEAEVAFYATVLETIKELRQAKKIKANVRERCLKTVEDLRFLHANNVAITREFAENRHSVTYGAREALHTTGDAEFQMKAGVMYAQLREAWLYAQENNLVVAFLNEALGKQNGCLEDRYDGVCEWLRDKKRLSGQTKMLRLTAIETVYEHLNLIDPKGRISRRTFPEYIKIIVEHFDGKVGSDNQPITCDLVDKAIRAVYMGTPVNSPEKLIPQKNPAKSEGRSTARKNLFNDEDLIQANRNSILDVKEVVLDDGSIAKASIVAVDADGNCGFTALMGENRAITREQFIEDVQERYLAGDNQVLNTLIARAIQEAGARDIHDWMEQFRSPGYWMNETHLEIYAFLYGVRISGYTINNLTNQFELAFRFNEQGRDTATIAYINLQPAVGERRALNHFEGLVIGERLPLAPPDDEGVDLDIFRRGDTNFFSFSFTTVKGHY